MSRATQAARLIMVKALADALKNGTYAAYDGDGRLMGTATLPEKFDCDFRGFKFGKAEAGRCVSGGDVAGFALYPPGDISKTTPLLVGTIGRTLGKGVDAVMDDQTVYAGMLMDVDEVSYQLVLPE